MKNAFLFVVALLAAGCGSSDSESIVGDWLYSNGAQSAGAGLTVNDDGTYVASVLVLTSSTTANVQVEDGSYVAGNGKIAMTPVKWSCDGPDPITTDTYSFSGANLVLVDNSGAITLAPNPPSTSATTFILTVGCFAGDGTFTAHPIAPVTN